jgi:hypothetical protein
MRTTQLEALIPMQNIGWERIEEYVPTLKLQLLSNDHSGNLSEGELTIPVSHLHHKVEISNLVKGLEENINNVMSHSNISQIVDCSGLVNRIKLDLTDIPQVKKPELKTYFKSVELDSDYIHVKFRFSSVRKARSLYANEDVPQTEGYTTIQIYHQHSGIGLPTMTGCR